MRTRSILRAVLLGAAVLIVVGLRAHRSFGRHGSPTAPTGAGEEAAAAAGVNGSTASAAGEQDPADGGGAASLTLPARRGDAPPSIDVAPLPGWPKWAGELNHQISGLAYREGRLYAVSDQAGAWTRAILEIDLEGASSKRTLPVSVVCRWSGGPHPDAESLAIDPLNGPPRAFLMTLETEADSLIEVRAGTCEYLGAEGPLAGETTNEGIEGLALAPDGRTLYMTHETQRTLLTMKRGEPGPATLVAKIRDADSLCDAAYDDRGTTRTEDDRLLLLDRNGRKIFATTTTGEILGQWVLSKKDAQMDPDGFAYSLISFEGLAIASREQDGATIVYLSTDSPPKPFPYHRKNKEDPDGRYRARIGMLYKYRLPALAAPDVPAAASSSASGSALPAEPSAAAPERSR